MSYSILYDTQFIKTSLGIVPCILSGANNVWVTSRRRARDWGIFGKKLVTTKEEFLKAVEELPSSAEHWLYNGRWVDDEGLRRWARHSCDSAATLENIMLFNTNASLQCFVVGGTGHRMSVYPDSTEALETWLTETQEYMSKHPDEGLYPVVRFLRCDYLIKPVVPKSMSEKFFLKRGGMYLSEVRADTSGSTVIFSKNIREAKELSYMKAVEIMQQHLRYESVTMVKAQQRERRNDPHVIRLSNGWYVYKITARALQRVKAKEAAYAYSTRASAERALTNPNIQQLLSFQGLTATVERKNEEE